MSELAKLLLLGGTLLPFFYVFFIFIAMAGVMTTMDHSDPRAHIGVGVGLLFIGHLSMMCWSVLLVVLYIYLVVKNEAISKDMRGVWAVLMFVGHLVAMVIYWVLYIWPEPEPGISDHAPASASRKR